MSCIVIMRQQIETFSGTELKRSATVTFKCFRSIRINELIGNAPRVNNSVVHYNQIYHDNVHQLS